MQQFNKLGTGFALLACMMIKNKFTNIVKSKLFYGITLFVLAIGTLTLQDIHGKALNSSLQLSSSATLPSVVSEEEDSAELYYALKLRLLETQSVTMVGSITPIVLSKGSEVTVTVPGSYINNQTDISRINMANVIPQLPYSDPATQRNEVQISRLDFQPDLIGTSAQVDLREFFGLRERKPGERRKPKPRMELVGVEEDEAPDVSAETEAGDCIPGMPCYSENGLPLANHVGQARESLLDKFINAGKELLGKAISSMDDAINAFVNSDINKKLQAKLQSGFTLRLGKSFAVGRRITVRDGVESRPNRKCLRGVKEALLQSGVVTTRSGTQHAKNFGPDLKKEGFINLLDKEYKYDKIKSPYDAPEGAVLIYSGGRSGHVEIKTKTGFISDYYSKKARTGGAELGLSGDGRKLIGVYIKPTPEINTFLAHAKARGYNI